MTYTLHSCDWLLTPPHTFTTNLGLFSAYAGDVTIARLRLLCLPSVILAPQPTDTHSTFFIAYGSDYTTTLQPILLTTYSSSSATVTYLHPVLPPPSPSPSYLLLSTSGTLAGFYLYRLSRLRIILGKVI